MALDHSGINPDAGVAATRPEISPLQKPTAEYFLANLKSRRVHVMAENIPVITELKFAKIARRLAPNAEAPLNPSLDGVSHDSEPLLLGDCHLPAEKQKGRAQHDESNVVRTEKHQHPFLPFPQDSSVCQGRKARTNFNRSSASPIERGIFICPTGRVPDPTSNGTIDQGGPEENKHHEGQHSPSLRDAAGNDSRRRPRKHHLIESVKQFRNKWRSRGWGGKRIHETETLQISNKAAGGGFGKGQRVPPKVPLHHQHGERAHAREYHGERGFSTGKAAVKEG